MTEATLIATEEQSKTHNPISSGPPFGHMPDHTELPEEDGTFVKNFQEHPQSILITESLWPILQKLHPDRQYIVGQDNGIYWRLTDPYLAGAVSPDWFYIPDVAPTLDGQMRRSYVMWYEPVSPFIVMEFVSETDGRERDTTPYEGRFWIYERVIRPIYYIIYKVDNAQVDVYHLIDGRFQPIRPNERKHFEIPQLGIEMGIWRGKYKNVNLPWLRAWNLEGNLLPTAEERAAQEAQRADQETERAERLAAKLRALGIDPDEVADA
ncbi:MAG: Uma2 family endonuclease [Caldilineaceae bacterium]